MQRRAHTHAYTHSRTHTHTHTHARTHTHTHTSGRGGAVVLHASIHTHTHTYAHTKMHVSPPPHTHTHAGMRAVRRRAITAARGAAHWGVVLGTLGRQVRVKLGGSVSPCGFSRVLVCLVLE